MSDMASSFCLSESRGDGQSKKESREKKENRKKKSGGKINTSEAESEQTETGGARLFFLLLSFTSTECALAPPSSSFVHSRALSSPPLLLPPLP